MGKLNLWSMALVALLACADDAPQCPQLEVCAITEPSCQQAIMHTVSCMRGGRAALPTVSLISEDALVERLLRDDTSSEDDRRRAQQWTDGLSLFQLAPAEAPRNEGLEDAIRQYAAVYLGDTQEILVVDRGDSLASEESVQLFAHELTHALQDAEHGLRTWRERFIFDVDSSLSTDAVVEGEAVFYELLVSLQLSDLSPHEVDWERYFTRWRASTLDASELDRSPVAASDIRFPYAFGGGYVTQHWLAGGRDAIRALWSKPPRTTREVMFGPFASANDRELAMSSLPQLGEGFTPIVITQLGAWLMRQYAARVGIPVGERLRAAEVLRYDAFTVQASPAGEVVAAWHVELDDPGVLLPTAPGLSSTRQASSQWFLVGSDLPRDLSAVAWGPLTPAGEPGDARTASVPRAPLRHANCLRSRPPRIHATR